MTWRLEHRPENREGHPALRPWRVLDGSGRLFSCYTTHKIAIAALDLLQDGAPYSRHDIYRRIGTMGPKAATIARLKHLEAEHRVKLLVNRYLVAGKPERLKELGLTQAEIRRVTAAGGYPESVLKRSRETIRYYRKKSRRQLWLPDRGNAA